VSAPSGILLAGGASKRFGRPKVIEPVHGAPLFHGPLRALLETCDDIVVVIAPDASAPPLPPESSRIRLLRDEVAYEGPLVATQVGLRAIGGDQAVIVAGDMPGVRGALLQLMLGRRGKRAAVVLADADGPRPMPAVVAVRPALALAEELVSSGERRLRALMLGLDPEVLDARSWAHLDPEAEWRRDVNTPEDLARGR
jgi:molybdopterin-guanine dinucleotide biosynthesis protein A